MYLSFRLKWKDSFFFTYGGKLPRLLGGTDNTASCNKPTSHFITSLGWYRYNWKDQSSAMLSPYVYHLDQPKNCGELAPVKDVKLSPGEWYTIQMHTKMNAPGKKNGVMEISVDGKKIYSRTNYRFRNHNGYSIDRFGFKTHFGGSNTSDWRPVKDEYTYYDDFVISTEPIAQRPTDTAHPPLRPTGVKVEKDR